MFTVALFQLAFTVQLFQLALTVQLFPHTNIWWCIFDFAIQKVKGQSMTIIWIHLVDLDAIYQDSAQSFFDSGEEDI